MKERDFCRGEEEVEKLFRELLGEPEPVEDEIHITKEEVEQIEKLFPRFIEHVKDLFERDDTFYKAIKGRWTMISKEFLFEVVRVQKLNPQPDGTVTVTLESGLVMSVQPDGNVETRPAGSAGQYEKAIQKDNILIFSPSKSYAFAYFEV
jgi:hypothetical protein